MKPSLPASSWPGQASVLSLYSVTPVTARAKTYQFGSCQELKRATPKMTASRPAPPPPIRCSQVRRWSRRQHRTGARIRGCGGTGRRSFEHRPAAQAGFVAPGGVDHRRMPDFLERRQIADGVRVGVAAFDPSSSASSRTGVTEPQQIWQFMPAVRRCTFTGKTMSSAQLLRLP